MDRNQSCLYSGTHEIPIFRQNGFGEERNLSISILDYNDKLQIKLRDLCDYSFSFTENIDLGDFEVIRHSQSLDINFTEFKVDVVEMLQQFQKKEMYLKCQLCDKKCTLVFYTKSKIKSIVYLTLDLHLTSQRDVIEELVAELEEVQESNRRLQKQFGQCKDHLLEKQSQVIGFQSEKAQILRQFLEYLKRVEDSSIQRLNRVQNLFLNAIAAQEAKVVKLQKKIDLIKYDNNLKMHSSDRLVKTLENLRLENGENALTIEELTRQNNSLNIIRVNLEKTVADLKSTVDALQARNQGLETKKSDLEGDLEKMSVALRQNESRVGELSKDLVQANSMLVNFNNHYDAKAKEVEGLQEALRVQEEKMAEQKARFNDVLVSCRDYQAKYNSDEFEKLRQDLGAAERKVLELEENIRKLSKMNALLSQRIQQSYCRMP